MPSLVFPLIVAGVIAGLIQYFVDFKGLKLFDPNPKPDDETKKFGDDPDGAWAQIAKFFERVWSFAKNNWELFGYLTVGIAGALLTPVICEWIGGEVLKGISPVKVYLECISNGGKDCETKKPGDWYTLVLVGYGIILGYSAVRIIRHFGGTLIESITGQLQRQLEDTKKKLTEAQKKIEELLANSGNNTPPIVARFEEKTVPRENFAVQDYYDEQKDALSKKIYYAAIDFRAPDRLADSLRDLLTKTHTTALGYKPSLHLYPVVDRYPDGLLRSIYSGQSFTLEELLEMDARIDQAREELWKGLKAAGLSDEAISDRLEELEAQLPYNCEHVLPQSWFGEKQPMRGDLHHLFTCESGCNNFRGNTKYYDFPDYGLALKDVVRNACGKQEKNWFEPEKNKGKVARAVLYFLVRYPASVVVKSGYAKSDIPMLIQWHKDESVSLYEKHRNLEIEKKQGNRNPFIDFPELVDQIDFDYLLDHQTDLGISPEKAVEPVDPFPNPTLCPPDAAGKNTNGARFGCSRNGGTKWHAGIDLKADVGTKFKAIYSGKVVDDVRDLDESHPDYKKGVGNHVIVRSKLFAVKYCHLKKVDVEKGDTIVAGQYLGETGKSGNAFNVPFPHLHIEISTDQFATNKNYIDPEPLLKTKYLPPNPNGTDMQKCSGTALSDDDATLG